MDTNSNQNKENTKDSTNEEYIVENKNIDDNQKEIYYSKENIYYKREKRKNICLMIIIIILLIYVWYCFTYHWGYIMNSGNSSTKSNTIDTSGEVTNTSNNTNRNNDIIQNNDTNQSNSGTYQLTKDDEKKFEDERNDNTIKTDEQSNTLTPEEANKIKLIQTEDEKQFDELKNLDIFKNIEYSESKLIYPGLSGSYEFCIENYCDKDIKYKLVFMCHNPNNVNMMFKLKRNSQYISGDIDTYITPQELGKEDLALNSMTGDRYTLEWKWVDNDSQDIQSTDAFERGDYKLTIRGEI